MREMGMLIVEAAGLIAEAIPLLNRVGTHSARLSVIAEEVVRVEVQADDLHDEGLKDLFQRYGNRCHGLQRWLGLSEQLGAVC